LNIVNQKFRTQGNRIYFYVVIISIPVKNPYEKALPGFAYTNAEYSLSQFTIKCDQIAIL